MLGHVEREQLFLSDGRDRRRDGDDEEGDSERVERDPPPRHRLPATGERPCPYRVGDCDEDDGRELQRVERPARRQGRLHAVDCTLGPWAASRPTKPRASRLRRPMRWSSGCARPSSRPARWGSEGSPACIPSTATASSPRPRTRSGRSSSSRASAERSARAGRSRRALHQRRLDVRSRSALLPRLRGEPHRPRDGRRPRGGSRRGLPRGVSLVGGETAELPGIYREEARLRRTCVGLVERSGLIDGSRVDEGDVVVGLPSAGVHANGYARPPRARGRGLRDEDLLAPTRLYLDDARRLRARARTLARHGRRDPRESRACPTRRSRAEIDWSPGSGQRCSSGSPGMSPRTSFGVSSTSASDTSPSCRIQVTGS